MSRFEINFPGHSLSPCVKRLMSLPYVEQRSAEWLEQRARYITASEIANCLNLTAKVTEPYIAEFNLWDSFKPDPKKCAGKEGRQKYIEKKSGHAEAFTGNQATRFGQLYENVAIRIYQQMKGMDVFEFGLVPHAVLDVVAASPDGCGANGTLVEIKCPSTRSPTGIPPFEYWCQMQSQMECCDAETCDFFDASFVEFVDYNRWKDMALTWEKKHPRASYHLFGMYHLSDAGVTFAPVSVHRVEDFESWFEQEKRKADVTDTLKPVYYNLMDFYLTPVKRNRQWFADIISDLTMVHTEILARKFRGPAVPPTKTSGTVLPKKRQTEENVRSLVCLV